MNRAFLLMGGNIGNRTLYLEKARDLVAKLAGQIISTSSIYETAAWGLEEQPAFLNQVLLIETILDAKKLLTTLLFIETELGRERLVKFGPRIIDLDILFFNDEQITEEDLKIPHPALEYRRFALMPLEEIAASLVHPALRKTVRQLLLDCEDPLKVTKIESQPPVDNTI